MFGTIHFSSTIAALISGGLGTALMIYRLFDGFGPFHWLAIASIALITAGATPVYRRSPKKFWILPHSTWMTASYVGLWAAAVAETTTRSMDFAFGPTVIISSMAVIGGGAIAMRLLLPKALARFGL